MTTQDQQVPLVEMRHINVAFGGVHAVEDASIDLFRGEVVAIVGGNGAGKTTLIRTLSGAHPADSGEILIDGEAVTIQNPRDAKALGVETIYQTLALAENQDAASNMFLGRELRTRIGTLDNGAMEDATRKVMARLNPKCQNFRVPVVSLSGGQRQGIAIAKAVYFNARIIIMDEPTAALGPAETAQVGELIEQLKADAKRACAEKADSFQIIHIGWGLFEHSWRIRGFENPRLLNPQRHYPGHTIAKPSCQITRPDPLIIIYN